MRGLEPLLGAPKLVEFRAHAGAVTTEDRMVVQELEREVRAHEATPAHAADSLSWDGRR